MTLPFAPSKVYLDSDLVADIEHAAGEIDRLTGEMDNQQLIISLRVNEMWDEHKNILGDDGEKVFNTRLDYFAECSRIANLKSNRHIFALSGETLKRWCEVVETYENLDGELRRGYELSLEVLLDALTFHHLYKARQLYFNGKVNSPLHALAEAMSNQWSVEEMELHYDGNSKSIRGGFISYLQKFLEKKLPRLEFSKEKLSRITAKIEDLITDIQKGE